MEWKKLRCRRVLGLLRAASILGLVAFATRAAADSEASASGDWPQWRGPERNGVSSVTGLLKSWSEKGPAVVWRIPGGEGFSGISIARGRAYTMFARGNTELVVCLDAATGKEVWRAQTGTNFRDRQGGNGPRSTPLVAGDQVFVLSANGTFYALEAKSGAVQWKSDFAQQFGSQAPRWGFSTSPLVEGDLVLVEAGGGGGKSLVAFARENGRVIWASQGDKPSYSSPLAITVGGMRQIVFFTAEGPVAVTPAEGRLLWRHTWHTSYDVNAATPVFVAPDRIFISSGYDKGAALLRIKAGGAGVEQVWQSRVMKNHMATSVLHQGHLYGFDAGTLKCIEAASGESAWRKRGLGKGSLILADGHLFVLGEGGDLALVEATPVEYREKGRVEVFKSKCWTAPSLSGGKLYLRDEREIVCLDVRVEAPTPGRR